MSDAQEKSVETRMSDAVEAMDRDFNHIRTGRASTALVERIVVDYYGTQTPLNQLASISVPESTSIVIQPSFARSVAYFSAAAFSSSVGLAGSFAFRSSDIMYAALRFSLFSSSVNQLHSATAARNFSRLLPKLARRNATIVAP